MPQMGIWIQISTYEHAVVSIVFIYDVESSCGQLHGYNRMPRETTIFSSTPNVQEQFSSNVIKNLLSIFIDRWEQTNKQTKNRRKFETIG